MSKKAVVNLTTTNATYTSAAGDYEINGLGGNDTITTGAGNSSVNTGLGNSTITTGAGDSIVHTGDGNQTITTGAGHSSVTTGWGNSTITTGAGDSTVWASGGNNTVTTGAGASQVTTGTGDDTITAGAGDAVVDSGTGDDTVTTGAGNDLVSYHVTGNAGHHNMFTAAAGIDTLNLVMTRAEWMSDAVQTDVANYLSFLAANKGASGENNATAYAFTAFGLTTSGFEKLQVQVDGVSIDPANHPVALGDDVITTTENEVSAAVDVLGNDSVPDLIKTLTYTNPANGSVQLDAAYSHTASPAAASFTYTPAAGFYDYLAVGETASDAFSYTVTDATGDVKTATVAVTITGTNDAPVITSETQAGSVSEGNDQPLSTMSANGTISYSDLDLTDAHTLRIGVAAAHGSATVDAQGNWSYTVLDAGTVNALADGEHLGDSFTVLVDDGHGGTASQLVHIDISGTNDAPVITSALQAGAVQEDSALVATGTVASSDVDNNATASYSGSAVGSYGSFAVNAATGVWTYTLANAAHQNLAQGEVQSETFHVTVTDDKGATATQAVVMSIAGTNDAPVITSALQAGAVQEDGALVATGTVASSDVDNNATASYSGSAVGSYGSFAVNAATGVWTYTLDNAANQNLAEGESHGETFTVTVTDDKGATASQAVVMSITGTNDAPVITSALQAGAVQEDTATALSASGTVASSDVDNNATASYSGSAVGSYGSFAVNAATGVWTYTLDNAAHQNLAQGEVQSETFTVTVTDDKGATASQAVVMSITGTNDAPVITSALQAGAVQEDTATALSASGTVASSDVDNNATASYSGSAVGSYGSFAVNAATGVWTYTLDNAANQNLAEGESHGETFTVTVTDDKGATASQAVVMSITGTNDAPVITSAMLNGSVTEQVTPAGNLTSSGTVNFSDVDLSDSHTVSAVAASSSTLGTLTASVSLDDSHTTGLGGVVSWAYSVADSAVEYLAAGQTKVETFTVSLNDGHGGVVPSTVSVTITGTNDAPVIDAATSSFAGAVTEQVALSSGSTTTSLAFSSHTDYAIGSRPYSVTSADVNGDGKADLIATRAFDNSVSVFLGKGDGTFAAKADYATGSIPASVTSADVNGDGKADLIAANQGVNSNSVSVLLGKGDGTFAAKADYATGSIPASVTSADVNGDGKADLIAANYGNSTVSVLLGKGDGTFAAKADYATGRYPTSVTSADVNGDGKADLIAANAYGNSVSVLINTSLFIQPVTAPLTSSGVISFSDVDLSDVHTVSAVASVGENLGTLTASVSVDDSHTTGLGGVVSWAYSVADSAVEYLAAGETKVETFTVTLSDGHGALVPSTVSVTITGTNEAPIVAATDVTGAVTELRTTPGTAMLTDSGTIVFSDVDLTDIHSVSTVTPVAGALGTLTASVSTDTNHATGLGGQVTWNYSVADSAVEYLVAGQTKLETFSFDVLDGQGASVARTVSVIVTGTNDAAVISGNSTGAVKEDTTLSTSGTLAVADVDQGQAVFQAQTNVAGHYGSFDIGASGNWTYALNNGAANVQALAAGEQASDSFTVVSQDGTASQVVNVAITGTNDAASISGNSTGAVTEDTTLSTSGTLAVADVDQGQAVFQAQTNAAGSYGSFSIGANGNWTYALNNGAANVQALAVGQQASDSFTVVSQDGTASQVVNVAITGTNDAPVALNDTLPGHLPGLVAFYKFNDASNLGVDSSGNGNNLITVGSNVSYTPTGEYGGGLALGGNGYLSTVNGSVPAGVPLGGQNYTISSWFQESGPQGALGIIGWGNYGTQNQVNALRLGTGGESIWNYWWNHDVGTYASNVYDHLFHNLAVTYDGSTRSMYLDGTLVASDHAVGLNVQNANFAVGKTVGSEYFSGVLDNVAVFNTALTAAQVQTQLLDSSDLTNEDASVSIAGATLLANDTDVDTGDTKVLVSVQGASHGTVSLSGETVTFTPELNYNGAASFSYTIQDLAGAQSTATASFTIRPVNDAPVVATTDVTGAVTELTTTPGTATLTDSGTIAFSDVDLTDIHSVSAVTPVAGALGTLTASVSTDTNHTTGLGGQVTWNYSVDDSAVEYLAVGQTKLETFSFNVLDGQGASVERTVNVAITGTNDAPVAVADSASTNEDTPIVIAQANLLANDTDVDAGDTKTMVSVGGAQHGTVVQQGANVIYTPTSNYNGADSFTYQMKDAAGLTSTATVSVTVNAVNDAPAISMPLTGAISLWTGEGNGVDVIGGNNAILNNGVGFAAGHDGQAFSFDGVNDYATVTRQIGNDFTIGGWIKTSTTSPTGTEFYSGNGLIYADVSGEQNDFGISILNNKVAFGTGNPTKTIQSTTEVTDGQWVYLAAARNGSTISLYINGVLEALTNTGNSAALTAPTTIFFGGNVLDSRFYTGLLDDVNFYNRALSAAEIEASFKGLPVLTAVEDTALNISLIRVSDIDSATDPLLVSISAGHGSLALSNTTGLTMVDADGSDGSLSFTGSQAAINSALASNVSYTPGSNYNGSDTLSVTVNDLGHNGAGGTLSTTKNILLTVTAVNDAPIVAAADVTGAVTELTTTPGTATLTDAGTIALTDVDLTDIHSVSTVTKSAGALGSLTASVSTDSTGSGTGGVVTWNYSVADSAVEYLATGQTKVETFSFNLLDGQGASVARTVSVTVTGTNDAASISGNSTGAVTEDSTLSTSGTLAVADVDHGQAVFQAQTNVAGHYGSFDIGASGNWTYALNNGAANVQALAAGEQASDSFTVLSQDGTASQLVTVAVNGLDENHSPVAVDDLIENTVMQVASVLTFEEGTYSRNGNYSPNTWKFDDTMSTEGFSFTLDTNTNNNSNTNNYGFSSYVRDYWGADYSNTLYSFGYGGDYNGGPSTTLPIAMTHADGSSFSLLSANITSYSDGYDGSVYETVTGYSHGVQVAQQTFNVPDANDGNHNNVVTFSDPGFSSVDKVVFSLTSNGNNYYYSHANYNYEWIDNVGVNTTAVAVQTVDRTVDINVLANDSDIDSGAHLSVSSFSGFSTHGAAVSLNANGTLHYDPTVSAALQALNQGTNVYDSFTYQAQDEFGALSNQATVSINVIGVAHAAAA